MVAIRGRVRTLEGNMEERDQALGIWHLAAQGYHHIFPLRYEPRLQPVYRLPLRGYLGILGLWEMGEWWWGSQRSVV